MTFPSRGVRAGPVFRRGRVIEHARHPIAHASRGDRFLRPDRRQDLQHQWLVDRVDGQRTDDRKNVIAHGRRELCAVFRIAPFAFMCGVVFLGTLLEGDGASGLKDPRGARGALRFEGINTVEELEAGGLGASSRFGEAHGVEGTKAKRADLLVALIPKQPAGVSRAADLQPQTVTVAVSARPLQQPQHLLRGEHEFLL
jgi:hypothetical protein